MNEQRLSGHNERNNRINASFQIRNSSNSHIVCVKCTYEMNNDGFCCHLGELYLDTENTVIQISGNHLDNLTDDESTTINQLSTSFPEALFSKFTSLRFLRQHQSSIEGDKRRKRLQLQTCWAQSIYSRTIYSEFRRGRFQHVRISKQLTWIQIRFHPS